MASMRLFSKEIRKKNRARASIHFLKGHAIHKYRTSEGKKPRACQLDVDASCSIAKLKGRTGICFGSMTKETAKGQQEQQRTQLKESRVNGRIAQLELTGKETWEGATEVREVGEVRC
eukprot:762509-Hanusia_phi.AAC.4